MHAHAALAGPAPGLGAPSPHAGRRPDSAFAGHVHNYRHSPIDGRSHIRLGPTGGLWLLGGPEGNFDHVTQVTLTDDGPVLANILLEGVRDIDG